MGLFKQTDIGLIPEDWEVTRIRESFTFTKKPHTLEIAKDVEIPFISMDLIPDNKIYVEDFKLKKYGSFSSGTYFENGDVLLAKITPSFENGKQAIVKIPFSFGYATTEVIPINELKDVSSKYFLFNYLLKSDVRKTLAGKMEGSTGRQRLPKTVLQNTLIPLPPLPEQKKIAHVLSKIQQAIETQEQIIKTTQELKKTLMQKLFTDGLSSEPQKQTEIGLIPESWDVKSLEKLTVETYTRNPSKENPNKFIKYVDVSAISNESFKIINHQFVKGSEAPGRARKVIKTNDIIFATIRPTLKRIAKVNSGYNDEYCSTAFCVLRTNGKLINEDYLYYYLQTDFFIDEIAKLQSGASYPAVRDDNVKSMMIPLPKIPEQKQIADLLLSLDRKLTLAFKKKSVSTDLFSTMLEKLMTGQIRVKDIEFKLEEMELN